MIFNDRTNSFSPEDIAANKNISAISYLWILFFLPLIACPSSQFGKFHANQALILFIASVISGFLGVIPFIGWILSSVASLLIFIAFIFEIVNTLQGKAIELPYIGGIQIIK